MLCGMKSGKCADESGLIAEHFHNAPLSLSLSLSLSPHSPNFTLQPYANSCLRTKRFSLWFHDSYYRILKVVAVTSATIGDKFPLAGVSS